MNPVRLLAAFGLLLPTLCAAQDVTVCAPNSDQPAVVAYDPFGGVLIGPPFEALEKPKVSSPPANSMARDPRYPGVYEPWRFRYVCDPIWFVIEGWATKEGCEAGRQRFLVVNPNQQVTLCAAQTPMPSPTPWPSTGYVWHFRYVDKNAPGLGMEDPPTRELCEEMRTRFLQQDSRWAVTPCFRTTVHTSWMLMR